MLSILRGNKITLHRWRKISFKKKERKNREKEKEYSKESFAHQHRQVRSSLNWD